MPLPFSLLPLLKLGATRLLDLLLPPLCSSCRAIVGANGTLCPACWRQLNFIAAPHCTRCGVPFELEVGDNAQGGLQCGACIAAPPRYDRARAPLLYDDASRGLILRFKHGDALQLARSFAPLLAGAGAALLARADLLVPVPLARGRLWKRRYNQAALLAHAVGREAKIKVAPDLLRRVRKTPSQGGLSRAEREKNVKGAFALARHADVKGKIVIVIDDVLTSGATVGECARVLLKAGAARVDVLTVARVKRDS